MQPIIFPLNLISYVHLRTKHQTSDLHMLVCCCFLGFLGGGVCFCFFCYLFFLLIGGNTKDEAISKRNILLQFSIFFQIRELFKLSDNKLNCIILFSEYIHHIYSKVITCLKGVLHIDILFF